MGKLHDLRRMNKLSGHEGSVLAFIARAPASEEAASLASGLKGSAKRIADAIINETAPIKRKHKIDKSILATANAMRSWARKP